MICWGNQLRQRQKKGKDWNVFLPPYNHKGCAAINKGWLGWPGQAQTGNLRARGTATSDVNLANMLGLSAWPECTLQFMMSQELPQQSWDWCPSSALPCTVLANEPSWKWKIELFTSCTNSSAEMALDIALSLLLMI